MHLQQLKAVQLPKASIRAVMNLVRQAVQEELRPRPTAAAKASSSAEDFTLTDPRDWVSSWRRIVLRVFVALSAARSLAVAQELQVLEPYRFNPELGPEPEDKNQVTRAIVFARGRLSNSKSVKVPIDPEDECRHLALVKRGGKTYWWSCASCPARWPRLSATEVLVKD